MSNVRWQDEPDEHDYPAAAAYLALIADPATVTRLVKGLKRASIAHAKAKDILRASGLPVLLVRGDIARGLALQIADGYHRVCASYRLDEDTDIPCRIVGRL